MIGFKSDSVSNNDFGKGSSAGDNGVCEHRWQLRATIQVKVLATGTTMIDTFIKLAVIDDCLFAYTGPEHAFNSVGISEQPVEPGSGIISYTYYHIKSNVETHCGVCANPMPPYASPKVYSAVWTTEDTVPTASNPWEQLYPGTANLIRSYILRHKDDNNTRAQGVTGNPERNAGVKLLVKDILPKSAFTAITSCCE